MESKWQAKEGRHKFKATTHIRLPTPNPSSLLPTTTTTQPRTMSSTPPPLNPHLSYPSIDSAAAGPSSLPATAPANPAARPLLKDRLYVGNLHPTVDECVFVHSSVLYEDKGADMVVWTLDTPCSRYSQSSAKS